MRDEKQVRADIEKYRRAVEAARTPAVKAKFQHVLEQLRDELTYILVEKHR